MFGYILGAEGTWICPWLYYLPDSLFGYLTRLHAGEGHITMLCCAVLCCAVYPEPCTLNSAQDSMVAASTGIGRQWAWAMTI